MRFRIPARTFFVGAFLAAAALLCVSFETKNPNSVSGGLAATNDSVKVDFDFTRMNPTMMATYSYRLAANPREFAGKTLRLSGTFLTRVDEEDGKRQFGCLMDNSGGCSCCGPGNVLEFVPKDSYTWPTGFPPVESRITVTGRLVMSNADPPGQFFSFPRLVDADVLQSR